MPSALDNVFFNIITEWYDAIDNDYERKEWIENTLKDRYVLADCAEEYLEDFNMPKAFMQAILDCVFWDNVLEDVREYVEEKNTD